METLRKNHEEMGEIKNTITEMTSAFGRLISSLDIAKDRKSELEDMSIDLSQREKRINKNRSPWLVWFSGLSTGQQAYKGRQFDSWSGHMPGLQPSPPLEVCKRQPSLTHQCFSLFLPPFLSLSK